MPQTGVAAVDGEIQDLERALNRDNIRGLGAPFFAFIRISAPSIHRFAPRLCAPVPQSSGGTLRVRAHRIGII